ncbi:hypothetical protein D018_0950B, partial [Vibrio parahaemolyticus VP2007-007]
VVAAATGLTAPSAFISFMSETDFSNSLSFSSDLLTFKIALATKKETIVALVTPAMVAMKLPFGVRAR